MSANFHSSCYMIAVLCFFLSYTHPFFKFHLGKNHLYSLSYTSSFLVTCFRSSYYIIGHLLSLLSYTSLLVPYAPSSTKSPIQFRSCYHTITFLSSNAFYNRFMYFKVAYIPFLLSCDRLFCVLAKSYPSLINVPASTKSPSQFRSLCSTINYLCICII